MKVRGIVVGLALVLPLSACSRNHPVDGAPAPDASAAVTDDDGLTLTVENHNWSDILVYVVHDGVKTRFVQVTATKSLSQPVPQRYVSSAGTVQLVAHRIGGHDDSFTLTGEYNRTELTRDDYVSPTISIRTGNVITLTLESDLKRSTIGVW